MAIAEMSRAGARIAPEEVSSRGRLRSGRAMLVVAALLAVAGLLWRRAEMLEAARTIRDVDPRSVVAAVLLLILGLVNRGALHQTAHRTLGMPVRLAPMVRLGAAVSALNKVVRSGGAVGIALFISDGCRHGRPAERVVVAYLLSSLAGQLALATLLVPAVLLAHQSGQISDIWLAAGIGVLVYTVALLGAAFGASRSTALVERIETIIRRVERSEGVHNPCKGQPLDLAGLVRDEPRQVGRLVLHAFVDKTVGLATLTVTLVGLGANFEPGATLVSYCVALVSSMVGLVPGGIGAVEVSLGAALAAAEVPAAVINSGVLAFRFFDLWMPVLIGIPTLRALNRRSVERPPTLELAPVEIPTLGQVGSGQAAEQRIA